MKKCPVCNELLGDNVEICFKCRYNFNKKVFICNKCGKTLLDERSSCECGGWATSQSYQYSEENNSIYTWTRSGLKENAKARLFPIMLLAIIACLIVSISTALTLTVKRPFTYRSMNPNEYSYYDDDVNNFVTVKGFNNIPAELKLRIGWLNPTIAENTRTYISGVLIYTYLILLILSILLYQPYLVGVNRFFMNNIYGKAGLKSILFGFYRRNYLPVMGKMYLMNLRILLWSLLLVIPGIIKAYDYLMVPYLLSENPHINMKTAFRLSREMMYGNKWEVFVLDLSFILWNALSVLTLGIAGVVWVTPYRQATKAELYDYFRVRFLKNNLASESELTGFDSETNRSQTVTGI